MQGLRDSGLRDWKTVNRGPGIYLTLRRGNGSGRDGDWMQSAWNHCAPGGRNDLQIAGGLFSALFAGRRAVGAMFCRPLKRALGNEESANPSLTTGATI